MIPLHPGRWTVTVMMACIIGSILVGHPSPARAQEEQAAQSVWCSITDGNSGQLFISDPMRLPQASRMRVFAYGGRFARTVNMRYGVHYALEGNYCFAFPSPRRAAIAHADLIARMADRNFQIVTVGIF
ncbi:hypothetical protein [Komagataeibacter saccharivorans]|uniref:hypothetical protein n=1 Tax=Komagataeibacter saccharivorans TaxID=265959 RepID=UPI0024A9E75B|nr:hypothetical protein [Komagataeibacter saccharivorans]